MIDPEVPIAFHFGGALEPDHAGRLYDRRIRAQLKRLPLFDDDAKLGPVEALKALQLAGRGLSYVLERWADNHGLSEIRLQLLILLRHTEGGSLTLGQIATSLDISPRTVTGLVDILERDDLVRRVPDSGDRRAIRADLTPAGLLKADAVWQEAMEHQFPMLEGFSPDEIGQLRDLCFRVLENVSRGRT